MRPCFNFTQIAAASAGAEPTELLSLNDEIGFWGVQAQDFRNALDKVKGKNLKVEINSPGGDVFAGLAMYNMLKQSGKAIAVVVTGVAASAASLVAMAGDTISMPQNTFMMVHNPWGVSVGNAAEMRETADVLDKIGASLTSTYVAKTGQTEAKIKELLSKDTWLTADESKELGFATEVTDKIDAKASFDMARADLPEHIKAIYLAAKPKTEPKIEPKTEPVVAVVESGAFSAELTKLVKDAGLEAHTKAIVVASTDLEDGKKRIAAAKDIIALCKLAERPDDAKKAIKANKSVTEVRAELVKAMAEGDEHVDTKPAANQAEQASGKKTSKQIYQDRADRKAAARNKTAKTTRV